MTFLPASITLPHGKEPIFTVKVYSAIYLPSKPLVPNQTFERHLWKSPEPRQHLVASTTSDTDQKYKFYSTCLKGAPVGISNEYDQSAARYLKPRSHITVSTRRGVCVRSVAAGINIKQSIFIDFLSSTRFRVGDQTRRAQFCTPPPIAGKKTLSNGSRTCSLNRQRRRT